MSGFLTAGYWGTTELFCNINLILCLNFPMSALTVVYPILCSGTSHTGHFWPFCETVSHVMAMSYIPAILHTGHLTYWPSCILAILHTDHLHTSHLTLRPSYIPDNIAIMLESRYTKQGILCFIYRRGTTVIGK